MFTKESLKDVFSGISSVMFQKTPITITPNTPISLVPDYDLPVHVDDLTMNEGESTVNHYKVFGLDTDWTATAEKGEFEINLLIPTLHEEVLKLAYGEDSVSAIMATLTTDTYSGYYTTWQGKGVELGTFEVNGSIILLNQAKDRLFIASSVKLWASIAYENGTTDPVGIRLRGTITSNGTSSDILFLTKTGIGGGGA